jgi:pimeloyl-ACP methyl ester carboxylesterase
MMSAAAQNITEPDPVAQRSEQVGVILVHGIGEQRRFEFLDAQIRHILRAIKRRPGTDMSVEIAGAPSAAFHAEQDTWAGGGEGAVRAHIREGGTELTITFHEVWWADVNEPYSLAKQIRFWFWGLAVWAYPRSGTHSLLGDPQRHPERQQRVRRPRIPNEDAPFFQAWIRTRLFLVGVFFLLGGFTIGVLTVIAERVFRLRPPDLLQTLTNIVSGVKLYNQRQRFGAGFAVWPETQDFLDTLDEPPRVSARRRMIRTIADVGEKKYNRWYIVAHSLGTVVAFNGLMELPEAWPGYFDRERWKRFCINGFAGPARPDYDVTAEMPRRPIWADRDVAYRSRIFSRFCGFLTLGSPLAKFAAIWPARVPIANLRAFRPHTEWLNVYDPLDPVSGSLDEFRGRDPTCCPSPVPIGYRADWRLLLSHLRYLTCRPETCLADGVARWLIDGQPDQIVHNSRTCRSGETLATKLSGLGAMDIRSNRPNSCCRWCPRLGRQKVWLAVAGTGLLDASLIRRVGVSRCRLRLHYENLQRGVRMVIASFFRRWGSAFIAMVIKEELVLHT